MPTPSEPIAIISAFHEEDTNTTCSWCSREGKEAVTVSLAAGLLTQATVCMKCFTNALRVAAQRSGKGVAAGAASESDKRSHN